jgi:ubiquitin-protein ligase
MQHASRRIIKELAEAQSPGLRAAGIYYWFDEANTKRGKALVIGPAGTPYEACPLIFDIQLPVDYPFSSPHVTFMTSDGVTRFHPNLYVTGKVCLSILGTWPGPAWSAALNISKMLMTIQSLLEANPIVNEPTFERLTLENEKAKGYAEFVEARLIGLSVRDLLRFRTGQCPPQWLEFRDVFDDIADGLIAKLKAKVATKASSGDEQTYSGLVYSMSGKTEWGGLLKLFEPL